MLSTIYFIILYLKKAFFISFIRLIISVKKILTQVAILIMSSALKDIVRYADSSRSYSYYIYLQISLHPSLSIFLSLFLSLINHILTPLSQPLPLHLPPLFNTYHGARYHWFQAF